MATVAVRRDQTPTAIRLSSSVPPAPLPDLPPISALFLIEFDVKAGYTIVWKQALSGLELDGIVEYKSLPSGLHTVPDDLVYFVHDHGHAGLSAFLNTRTQDEELRNARMIAVGILVPLSYGRLGRAWRHAENLQHLARKLADDPSRIPLLHDYWEENRVQDSAAPQALKDTALDSPALDFKMQDPGAGRGHARDPLASDGAALLPPGHRLSALHPVWSLTSLLDTFGPLIFPIHRAALLRKRILISTHAPVHEVCNFVYNLSILTSIPLSVVDTIAPSASTQRLQPLFTIGVHDIPFLSTLQASWRSRDDADDMSITGHGGLGWVACTTDSILALKEDLWDVLITLPLSFPAKAKEKTWPTIESPQGVSLKATQRDLRRFRSLKAGLSHLADRSDGGKSRRRAPSPGAGEAAEVPSTPKPSRRQLSRSSRPSTGLEFQASHASNALFVNEKDTDKIVESSTWAELAYNGFMWWASAGEQRHGDEAEESAKDASLLADLVSPMPSASHRRSSVGRRPSSSAPRPLTASVSWLTSRRMPLVDDSIDGQDQDDGDEDEARVELAIIAYFHRLTTSILTVLADMVTSAAAAAAVADDDDDNRLDVDLVRAAGGDGQGAISDDGEDVALLPGGAGERDAEDDGVGWIHVDSDAMAQMGLDVWSSTDAAFVRDVTARYFARKACVEVKGVEICGLRVC